jgi:hypothetical protein
LLKDEPNNDMDALVCWKRLNWITRIGGSCVGERRYRFWALRRICRESFGGSFKGLDEAADVIDGVGTNATEAFEVSVDVVSKSWVEIEVLAEIADNERVATLAVVSDAVPGIGRCSVEWLKVESVKFPSSSLKSAKLADESTTLTIPSDKGVETRRMRPGGSSLDPDLDATSASSLSPSRTTGFIVLLLSLLSRFVFSFFFIACTERGFNNFQHFLHANWFSASNLSTAVNCRIHSCRSVVAGGQCVADNVDLDDVGDDEVEPVGSAHRSGSTAVLDDPRSARRAFMYDCWSGVGLGIFVDLGIFGGGGRFEELEIRVIPVGDGSLEEEADFAVPSLRPQNDRRPTASPSDAKDFRLPKLVPLIPPSSSASDAEVLASASDIDGLFENIFLIRSLLRTFTGAFSFFSDSERSRKSSSINETAPSNSSVNHSACCIEDIYHVQIRKQSQK